MISVIESVTESIRCSPFLYGCRTEVLDYYFLSSGNGMEWKNGCLVNPIIRDYTTVLPKDEDKQIQSIFGGLLTTNTNTECMIRESIRWDNLIMQYRKDNAYILAHNHMRAATKPQTTSILQIPSDAPCRCPMDAC